jgi:RNA polymerase sigma-70 factor (ECF subfamily)
MTLADLYEAFEGELHRYAIRLVRDSDQADDLVQETFIRAMANLELLGQLNIHQRRAWLYRVLKNLFLDAQNRRRREQALMEQLTQEAQFASDPWTEMMSPDMFELVPERYRELLQKRYLLGMTSEEIGTELGIPAATIRSRLHLAIKRLRAKKSWFL